MGKQGECLAVLNNFSPESKPPHELRHRSVFPVTQFPRDPRDEFAGGGGDLRVVV